MAVIFWTMKASQKKSEMITKSISMRTHCYHSRFHRKIRGRINREYELTLAKVFTKRPANFVTLYSSHRKSANDVQSTWVKGRHGCFGNTIIQETYTSKLLFINRSLLTVKRQPWQRGINKNIRLVRFARNDGSRCPNVNLHVNSDFD